MTVARQICFLEYGVSLSCKGGLKRTQTKTGVSEGGGGGEKTHANVNAAKRELFSSQKPKVFDCQLSQRFCRRHWLLHANWAPCERRVCSKAHGSQRCENVSLSSFHAAHAENRKRKELVFEWKQTFLKRDQNATTWKRGSVRFS